MREERLSMRESAGIGAVAERSLSPIWLSILIPVYNVAPYLRHCIDSILPQLPDQGVEVILVDDASTDDSRDICEDICAEHRQIRLLLHARNGGLSAARNTMLDVARGDYIWFVDSDDEILPGAIAQFRQVLDGAQPDLVLCDYEKEGKHVASFAGPTGHLSVDREAIVRGIFASRRMHTWTKIARRDLWADDLRFPIGRCFEDTATTPWLFLRARSCFHVPQPWIRYRVREGSITSAVSRTKGCFDDKKNDDLAIALVGFISQAEAELPDMAADTRYDIAQFCAKEFTKISWRLLSARFFRDRWGYLARKMGRYRTMMEDCSPMSFTSLARDHYRRGRPGRGFVLGLFLMLAPRQSGVSRRAK